MEYQNKAKKKRLVNNKSKKNNVVRLT